MHLSAHAINIRRAAFGLLAALCVVPPPPATAQTTGCSGHMAPLPGHKTVRHARHHTVKPPPRLNATVAPPQLPGSPAPVPDENAAAPPDDKPQQAEVSPGIMQLHYPPMGNGYIPGSSPQAMDDRRTAKAGGVEVTLPLHQAAPAPLPPPSLPP
jgi:hypothetical protein